MESDTTYDSMYPRGTYHFLIPDRDDRFMEANKRATTRMDMNSLTVVLARLCQTKPAARMDNGM
jgi:hypothetical protein